MFLTKYYLQYTAELFWFYSVVLEVVPTFRKQPDY